MTAELPDYQQDSNSDSTATPRDGGAATPRLPSVDNFRDIAGPDEGYAASNGRLRRGVVYRSNRLEASANDLAILETLGLTAVHDLREKHEIDAHPDIPITGAAWHHHPVSGIPQGEVDQLASVEQTYETMIAIYRRYVNDPVCREGFSTMLRALADTDGPQLFHCAAGKDRTGWSAVLIHHIAGVDRETMIADYLLTDVYATSSQKATLDSIVENLGPERLLAFRPAFLSDRRYLEAAFSEVDSTFGSLESYLLDGLHLSPMQLTAIRSRLLEPSA